MVFGRAPFGRLKMKAKPALPGEKPACSNLMEDGMMSATLQKAQSASMNEELNTEQSPLLSPTLLAQTSSGAQGKSHCELMTSPLLDSSVEVRADEELVLEGQSGEECEGLLGLMEQGQAARDSKLTNHRDPERSSCISKHFPITIEAKGQAEKDPESPNHEGPESSSWSSWMNERFPIAVKAVPLLITAAFPSADFVMDAAVALPTYWVKGMFESFLAQAAGIMLSGAVAFAHMAWEKRWLSKLSRFPRPFRGLFLVMGALGFPFMPLIALVEVILASAVRDEDRLRDVKVVIQAIASGELLEGIVSLGLQANAFFTHGVDFRLNLGIGIATATKAVLIYDFSQHSYHSMTMLRGEHEDHDAQETEIPIVTGLVHSPFKVPGKLVLLASHRALEIGSSIALVVLAHILLYNDFLVRLGSRHFSLAGPLYTAVLASTFALGASVLHGIASASILSAFSAPFYAASPLLDHHTDLRLFCMTRVLGQAIVLLAALRIWLRASPLDLMPDMVPLAASTAVASVAMWATLAALRSSKVEIEHGEACAEAAEEVIKKEKEGYAAVGGFVAVFQEEWKWKHPVAQHFLAEARDKKETGDGSHWLARTPLDLAILIHLKSEVTSGAFPLQDCNTILKAFPTSKPWPKRLQAFSDSSDTETMQGLIIFGQAVEKRASTWSDVTVTFEDIGCKRCAFSIVTFFGHSSRLALMNLDHEALLTCLQSWPSTKEVFIGFRSGVTVDKAMMERFSIVAQAVVKKRSEEREEKRHDFTFTSEDDEVKSCALSIRISSTHSRLALTDAVVLDDEAFLTCMLTWPSTEEVLIGFRSGVTVDQHHALTPEGLERGVENMQRFCKAVSIKVFDGSAVSGKDLPRIVAALPDGVEQCNLTLESSARVQDSDLIDLAMMLPKSVKTLAVYLWSDRISCEGLGKMLMYLPKELKTCKLGGQVCKGALETVIASKELQCSVEFPGHGQEAEEARLHVERMGWITNRRKRMGRKQKKQGERKQKKRGCC